MDRPIPMCVSEAITETTSFLKRDLAEREL
jgi:hypothetical protein